MYLKKKYPLGLQNSSSMDLTREEFSDRYSERIVLTCIVQNSDLIVDVEARLSELDFLSADYRALYAILKSLYQQGFKEFDLVTIIAEANRLGFKDLTSAGDTVNIMFNTVVSFDNISHFIERVLDASLKYKLYMAADETQKEVSHIISSGEHDVKASELISKADAKLMEILLSNDVTEDAKNISEGLNEVLLERASNPVDVFGYSTGIPLLDKKINGVCPKTLTVIAARAKGGKSTFLANLAANIAYRQGVPVLYIDTEMSRLEMQLRLVSHLSGVSHRAIYNGYYKNDPLQLSNVNKAMEIINYGFLHHKYMPGYTVEAIKSLVKKFKLRNNIGALIFDYIKVPEVTSDLGMKEHQILGNVATALKDLAGTLDIPVIAAAQIKRSEKGADKSRFSDQDVADSDRIGRYCDNLLSIGRKSKKEVEDEGETCGTHRMQVLLARSGGMSYHGIDVMCDFATLTMKQALHQSSGGFEDSKE